MKSYDVYLDSFVNIMLPDDVDPDSEQGIEMIYEKAIPLYIERLNSGDISMNWDRYEAGDEF